MLSYRSYRQPLASRLRKKRSPWTRETHPTSLPLSATSRSAADSIPQSIRSRSKAEHGKLEGSVCPFRCKRSPDDERRGSVGCQQRSGRGDRQFGPRLPFEPLSRCTGHQQRLVCGRRHARRFWSVVLGILSRGHKSKLIVKLYRG